MVHKLNKGKNGEREVATMLREVVEYAMKQFDDLEPALITRLQEIVQRNTNQSASGGCDIMVFGLAIEVKRQEQLQVDKWWNQCLKSASRNNHIPVLMYRQNRKAWRIRMLALVNLPHTQTGVQVVAEMDLDDFRKWLFNHVINCIKYGEEFLI